MSPDLSEWIKDVRACIKAGGHGDDCPACNGRPVKTSRPAATLAGRRWTDDMTVKDEE